MMKTAWFLTIFLLAPVGMLAAADASGPAEIDRRTLDEWAAPYRGWHYWPEPVIPADPQIPGHEQFRNTDVPCVYQLPGQTDKWFISFIAFDGKVFRDGDHWVMFYFGVGRGGAHIMVAFSRDLLHWTAHPEPLYRAGGHPGGLDNQYAHKISLVYNPANDTFYMHYCATGNRGRCIGLITSRPVVLRHEVGDARVPDWRPAPGP